MNNENKNAEMVTVWWVPVSGVERDRRDTLVQVKKLCLW